MRHWRRPPSNPGRQAYALPLLVVLLGIAAGVLASCPGRSQPAAGPPACAERGDMLRTLRQRFGETPVGRGMTDRGAVIELLVGPDGTWTLLLTFPTGRACMLASGDLWEPAARPGAGEL